jgi:hypothetical protein
MTSPVPWQPDEVGQKPPRGASATQTRSSFFTPDVEIFAPRRAAASSPVEDAPLLANVLLNTIGDCIQLINAIFACQSRWLDNRCKTPASRRAHQKALKIQ